MKKIDEIRSEIDEVDEKIVEFLNKRLNLVRELSRLKKVHDIDIIDKKREKEVLERAIQLSSPDNKEALSKIYSEIINACRELQVE
ncbi:MAG: chorismate mutase [Candidatus Hydrothermarchaeota archaeon]